MKLKWKNSEANQEKNIKKNASKDKKVKRKVDESIIDDEKKELMDEYALKRKKRRQQESEVTYSDVLIWSNIAKEKRDNFEHLLPLHQQHGLNYQSTLEKMERASPDEILEQLKRLIAKVISHTC